MGDFFIKHYDVILGVGFIIAFVVSILIYVAKSKLKNSKEKLNVSSKVIALDTIFTSSNIIASYVLIVFLMIGLVMLTSIETTNLGNLITLYIIGAVLVGMPILFFFFKIKNYISIKNGKYAIVIDELGDKKVENSTDSDHQTYTTYYLYFKKIFPTYNCRVIIDRETYGNSKKGDKFYILFFKENRAPIAYKCDKYILSDEMNDKITDVNDLEEIVNLKKIEFDVPEANEIILDRKRVLKEYSKEKRKTAIIDVSITIFFTLFAIYSVNLHEFVGTVILICLAVFFLLMSFVYIKGYLKNIREIKKGKYYFMEDEITEVNKNIPLKYSNTTMSFRTKRFKRVLYGDRKIFNGTKDGEILVLVFLESDKVFPLKFYKRKNVIIPEKDKIKSY